MLSALCQDTYANVCTQERVAGEERVSLFLHVPRRVWGFPCGSDGKESACNAGDLGSIPGLERSPGEGKGNPLQYSCLENPMDREAWWLQSMESQRVRHN